jgi:hypothetical protein
MNMRLVLQRQNLNDREWINVCYQIINGFNTIDPKHEINKQFINTFVKQINSSMYLLPEIVYKKMMLTKK